MFLVSIGLNLIAICQHVKISGKNVLLLFYNGDGERLHHCDRLGCEYQFVQDITVFSFPYDTVHLVRLSPFL